MSRIVTVATSHGFARLGAVTGILVMGVVALALAIPESAATGNPLPPPPRFDTWRIAGVLDPIAAEVERGAFPGASVAFGKGADEVYTFGLGSIGWTANAPAVDPGETIYDLASLTKLVATASAAMLLADDGRIELDEPVSKYLPNFDEGEKASVTFRHLLTHTSGLSAGAVLKGRNRAAKVDYATRRPVYPPVGAREEYSDIGYVLLWEALERAAGEPLTGFLERRLFEPLGMDETSFSPGMECERCAPTGRLRDQSLYRGKPFDPIAQSLDGLSGNAGLFSTASDLGRFAAMIANGGELDGVRVLSEQRVAEFVRPSSFGGYAHGWEVHCGADTPADTVCSAPVWIGHTGWTGTYLGIDPRSGVWVVLLTNRTYEPRANSEIQRLRREVFSAAAE